LVLRAIGSELFRLAREFNVPVITAHQLSKGAMSNDPGLEHSAGSFDLNNTAQLIMIISQTELQQEQDKAAMSIHKTKFGKVNPKKQYIVGFDTHKMRLSNLPETGKQSVFSKEE
jgi:replicative DNA helicase